MLLLVGFGLGLGMVLFWCYAMIFVWLVRVLFMVMFAFGVDYSVADSCLGLGVYSGRGLLFLLMSFRLRVLCALFSCVLFVLLPDTLWFYVFVDSLLWVFVYVIVSVRCFGCDR